MRLLENMQVLGLIVQSSGAGLLALLAGLLNRSYPNIALRYWAWGWLSLSSSSIALLLNLYWPVLPLQSLYLLGTYLFLYLLVLGCAQHLSGRRMMRGDARLLLPAFALAVAVPFLARGEFARLFFLQSFVLWLGFSAALWILWPGLSALRRRPGLIVMAVSLALLAVTFLHYLPVFGLHIATGVALPAGWLLITSIAVMLFESVLGFGSCMVVMEQLNQTLSQRNSDLALANEQFRELAERDPLTGTLNRRAFEAMRSYLSGSGCVAMLDVDRMKQINDCYGHAAGDRALCTVAHRLRTLVRAHDRVFRWGGDELLLLMPNMQQALLHQRLDQLNHELRRLPFPEGSTRGALSVSFGIAEYNESGTDLTMAVRLADEAMYARRMTARGIPPLTLAVTH